MFATRFAAVTAATLLTGAALAALTVVSPFGQAPVQKAKQHAMVVQAAGHWAGTISYYSPELSEPMVSDCTEKVHAIGDLWTVADFKAPFGGMNFHGSSTFGYDVNKEKFVGTWVDSMSTSITQMEGVYDEERGGIAMEYQVMNAETGEMQDALMVIKSDKNSTHSRFYLLADGEETLSMEIQMTRQKTVEAAAEKAAGEAMDAVEDAVDEVEEAITGDDSGR